MVFSVFFNVLRQIFRYTCVSREIASIYLLWASFIINAQFTYGGTQNNHQAKSSLIQTSKSPKQGNLIFRESFNKHLFKDWKMSLDNTVTNRANVKTTKYGFLGSKDKCIQIEVVDRGTVKLTRKNISIPCKSWIEVALYIRTIKLEVNSEYFLMVQQFDQNGKRIKSDFFPYDDGIQKPNNFGGKYKSPQTLGNWKQVRHFFKSKDLANHMSVSIVLRNGKQNMQFDELSIKSYGNTPPPKPFPLVFEKHFDDKSLTESQVDLLPHCEYEITCSAFKGKRVLPVSFFDLRQRKLKSIKLPGKISGDKIKFRLKVAADAATTAINFNGLDHVAIRLIRTPLPDDTRYARDIGNFIHKKTNIPVPGMVIVTAKDKAQINAHMAKRKRIPFTAELVRGGMCFNAGGKLLPPLIFATFNKGAIPFKAISGVGKRGVNIVRVYFRGAMGPGFCGMWSSDGSYDFTRVDEQIYGILKQNPNALIIFMPGGLYPPPWWGEAHPKEIIRNFSGNAASLNSEYGDKVMWGPMNSKLGRTHENYATKRSGYYKCLGAKVNTTYVASPASKVFRKDMGRFLTAMRQHIESMPYAPAVIGYHPFWGRDLQAGWIGTRSHNNYDMKGKKLPPQLSDYSVPMRDAFRQYLKDKYKTESNLQKAWKQPKLTFNNARMPSPEERLKFSQTSGKNRRLIFDQAKEQNIIDYNKCLSMVLLKFYNDMALAIKNADPRKVVVGYYYQDNFSNYDRSVPWLLSHSKIDYSGGPAYWGRTLGLSGISPQIYDSYRLHGKIDMTEFDHRIFPLVWQNYSNNQLFPTPRETIFLLQRETARQLCRGGGGWILDMESCWYKYNIAADCLGWCNKVFSELLKYDRSPIGRMAVFFPTSAQAYRSTSPGRPGYLWDTLGGRNQLTLSCAGVPVDFYYLNDLSTVAKKYKVFIFPNAVVLTAQEKALIKTLHRDGNILVFGPASGYASDTKNSVKQVEAVTGMKIEQANISNSWVRVTNSSHPLTKEIKGFIGRPVDCDFDLPFFAVTDSAALPLARYAKSNKVAVAVKNNKNWTSVYFGSHTLMPSEFFRGLAKFANLHIYSNENDVMFFAKQLIAIHASSSGTKRIHLPKTYLVKSIWDNKIIGKVKTIERKMQTGENALYLLLPSDN